MNNIKDKIYVEQILKDYSYEVYSGPIILFRAAKHCLNIPGFYDPHMGWSNIAGGRLKVKVIPEAGHSEIFKEPYVRILAEKLKEYLDMAQNDEFSENDRDF